MRIHRLGGIGAVLFASLTACHRGGYSSGRSGSYGTQAPYAGNNAGYGTPSGGTTYGTPSGGAYGTPTGGGGTGYAQQGPGAVAIRNHAYDPATITVRQGETVRWTNYDAVTHTVTCSALPAFDLRVAPGATVSWTFDAPSGDAGYAYSCSIHPQMQGRVVVQGR